MNDYSFNRIILDIIELLQDLKQQGMAFMFSINSTGSVDVTLFESDAALDEWSNADGKPIGGWYIMPEQTRMAHMCWNDLIAYKTKQEIDI